MNEPHELKPHHKCEMIFHAPRLGKGRSLWIGKLTPPIFIEGVEEKFCLHIKNQVKDIVILLNETDLSQFKILMSCAQATIR
jgi:hypothetical protein